MAEETLYLTLTARPERLVSDFFKRVFASLKDQTRAFDFLIINLSINDFVYDSLPEYLTTDEKVIINRTTVCGPCTKLIGSIDMIPNGAIVIVIDDDIIMRPCFIEKLYESYKLNPTAVSSSLTYERESFTDVAGYSGFTFKMTNSIRELKKFYATMPACAKFIDDTWFGWCFSKIGIPVKRAACVELVRNGILEFEASFEHPFWHELCRDTSREKSTEEFLAHVRETEKP